MKYNNNVQIYDNIRLKLIVYTEKHFQKLNAKRFLILNDKNQQTGQNLWIPNTYLLPDGTINPDKDLRWLFRKPATLHKLKLAQAATKED